MSRRRRPRSPAATAGTAAGSGAARSPTPHCVGHVFHVHAFARAVAQCRRNVSARLAEPLGTAANDGGGTDDDLDVSDLAPVPATTRARQVIDRVVASLKATDRRVTAPPPPPPPGRPPSWRPLTRDRVRLVRELTARHAHEVAGVAADSSGVTIGSRGGKLKEAAVDRQRQLRARRAGAVRARRRGVHMSSVNHMSRPPRTDRLLLLPSNSAGTGDGGCTAGRTDATSPTPDSEGGEGSEVGAEVDEVVLRLCTFRGSSHRIKAREFEVLGSQTLADLLDCADWFCATDEHVRGNRPHVPASFFLIGDTFFFDDRVEDALHPERTVAAVVARMLRRRNIGFAVGGGGGGVDGVGGAGGGTSGGTGGDTGGDTGGEAPRPMRQDGLDINPASMFWDGRSPRLERRATGASSSLPPSAPLSSASGSSSAWPSFPTAAPATTVARIGDFRVRGMLGVPFASLDIQLGAHYLYFHQGNCEHTFSFVDVRAHHHHHHRAHQSPGAAAAAAAAPSTAGVRALPPPAPVGGGSGGAFPRLVFRHKPARRSCSVCSVERPVKGILQRPATFVTFDDKLAGQSPCFFCEQCFWDLHYSTAGEKLYDFQGHPYFYDM